MLQGNKVREMKKNKAPKEEVMAAVEEMAVKSEVALPAMEARSDLAAAGLA